MSYLVIARKFRPQNFLEVTGQEHVTKTLCNSIKRGKIAHAYLFTGPRGVGKTSIARIFAKSLNCVDGPTATPCLKCANCVDITQGSSLSVREIDGASHNSVDNVRELIDSFRSLPPPGSKYKIYIIDEVHMLSLSAFNALLKSLEEPPAHAIFIMATTESHKIPDTVISRCQRHDLRALTFAEVEARLSYICTSEKIEADAAALRMIARLSEGSMRDAQSLLDRVQSFCDSKITVAEASQVLGIVDRGILFRMSEQIFAHDATSLLSSLNEAFSRGLDAGLFLKEFVSHWRDLLIAKTAGNKGLEQLGAADLDRAELLKQVTAVSVDDVQDLVQLAREGADQALRSAYPRYAFESLVVRMALRHPVKEMAEVVAVLKNLVNAESQRGPSPVAAAPRPQLRPRVETSAAPAEASAAPASQPIIVRSGVTPAAAPAIKAQLQVETTPQTDKLDWQAFVIKITSVPGTRILSEQLKRLSPQTFTPGVLIASGPEFSVAYVQQPDNRSKLISLLKEFSGQPNWKVDFTIAAPGAAGAEGSLRQVEEEQKKKSREERTQMIVNHPKIKSLQRVFPGSKIEDIKESKE